MDNACTLPTEILWRILDHAQYDATSVVEQPKYKWLKTYCRVSKCFATYAQSLLFYRVVIKGSLTCAKFKAIIQKNDRLRKCVRKLVVKMDHQTVFVETIALLEGLYELEASLYHASFRSEALAKFSNSMPKVRAMILWSQNVEPVHQLLNLFQASVERVSIDFRQCLSGGFGTPIPEVLPRLTEVRMRSYRMGRGATLVDLLRAIPAGNLTVLHLWDLPDEDVFKQMFGEDEAEGDKLSSLRSFQFRRHRHTQLQILLSRCTSLEEVQICLPLSKQILDTLPNSVEHISFFVASCGEEGLLLDYLNTKDPRRLRLITAQYEGIMGQPISFVQDPELEEACSARGVELRRLRVPTTSFIAEHEPLIPTKSFPRSTYLPTPRSPNNPKAKSTITQSKGASSRFPSSKPPIVLAGNVLGRVVKVARVGLTGRD